jgi:hypothetical protein
VLRLPAASSIAICVAFNTTSTPIRKRRPKLGLLMLHAGCSTYACNGGPARVGSDAGAGAAGGGGEPSWSRDGGGKRPRWGGLEGVVGGAARVGAPRRRVSERGRVGWQGGRGSHQPGGWVLYGRLCCSAWVGRPTPLDVSPASRLSSRQPLRPCGVNRAFPAGWRNLGVPMCLRENVSS